MQNRQLSPEKHFSVSSTGEDKSAMSSPSSQYRKHSESPTSSSPTSPGSSISQDKGSEMLDYTSIRTSESHEGITNDYKFDRISPELQNRNGQSLQMNANNCSRTTQPVRATSSTTSESKPTTLTTSSSTKRDHKPGQEETSYLSYPTALPKSGIFDYPGAFIKNLLNLEGDRIFYALYFDSVHGEVCIYEDETAKYTLLRSLSLLNHDRGLAENQRDDRFRCLVYAPNPENEAERVPFHCYEDLQRYHTNLNRPDKLVLAKFVPLGCLQKRSLEADKDQKSKHKTNYVLLWNLSTKPHSLWICYNYYTEDVEGYRRRHQLGKPTYYDEAYDFEYGPQTNAFDLEANLESDDRASQTCSYRNVFSNEDYCHDDDDYELLREGSPAELLPSRDTSSEDQKGNLGYFGIDRPFDLAVLASDINEWDGDTGLRRDSMYECLENLRFCLGDTLRARAWVSTVQMEP